MELQKRIGELMDSKEFVAKLEMAREPREVIALYKENGIEVPEAIAQELFNPGTYLDEGELSEESLEAVAGGGVVGGLIGTAAGNGIGYLAGYLAGRLAGWDKKKSKKYAKSASKFTTYIGTALGTLAIPV